jgi:hypothetical protein
MARLPTGWRHGDERSDGPQLQHRLRIGLAHLLELLRCQPRILRQCSQNSGLGLITREILGVWTRPIWARLTATTRLGDGAPPPAAPLSAASAPHPEPLEPPRKELEGTPAGSAPFAVEPFQQAVEVVAEREGADSRGADGLQSLPRERDPAVGPGEAEGYPLSILVHPRALPQDGLDAAVEPTGAEPAPSAPAMPLWKPLAGAGPGAGGSACPRRWRTPGRSPAGPARERLRRPTCQRCGSHTAGPGHSGGRPAQPCAAATDGGQHHPRHGQGSAGPAAQTVISAASPMWCGWSPSLDGQASRPWGISPVSPRAQELLARPKCSSPLPAPGWPSGATHLNKHLTWGFPALEKRSAAMTLGDLWLSLPS